MVTLSVLKSQNGITLDHIKRLPMKIGILMAETTSRTRDNDIYKMSFYNEGNLNYIRTTEPNKNPVIVEIRS